MAGLRIMSTNLLVDRADPDDLRRVIADVRPDAIAVQELGPRSAGVIAETHPHGRLDPRGDFFGLGIATVHPVHVERLHLAERSGWHGRLEPGVWPGIAVPLDVLNIHLVNPVDWPWLRSRRTRRTQVEQVIAHVSSHSDARVIVGDMNSTPAWREYKALAGLGVDAARVTGTAKRTWSHFIAGPRWIRIDHAFVSGVRPVSTDVVRIAGTDHRALVVDIEL